MNSVLTTLVSLSLWIIVFSMGALSAWGQTDERAKLVEGAKKEGKLVWYTSTNVTESKPLLGDTVGYANDLSDLVKKSDLIFISNSDGLFKELPSLLKKTKGKKTVIDPWGMFAKKEFGKNISYLSPGRKK